MLPGSVPLLRGALEKGDLLLRPCSLLEEPLLPGRSVPPVVFGFLEVVRSADKTELKMFAQQHGSAFAVFAYFLENKFHNQTETKFDNKVRPRRRLQSYSQ